MADQRPNDPASRTAVRRRGRILVAADQPLVRRGLVGLLGDAGFTVIDAGTTLPDPDTFDEDDAPDGLVVGVSTGDEPLLRAAAALRRAIPSTAILVISTPDEAVLFGAIRAGAAAVLPPNAPDEAIVPVLERILAGEFLINDSILERPAVAARVLDEFREIATRGVEAKVFTPLSRRETEILEAISRGNANKQVGVELGISEQTVKNHVSSILRKLAVNDRTEAVVEALRRGLIDLRPER